MDKAIDKKNREAEQVNPVKSGIRSGNPQLDPERAKRDRLVPDHRPDEPLPDRKPRNPPRRP